MVDRRLPEKSNKRFVASVVGACVGAAALFGIFSEQGIDFLGDSSTERSQEEAIDLAQIHYDETFVALSPAHKFTVQYAGVTKIRVDRSPGGNGIIGALTESENDFEISFNNGCLTNTAYDIDGGNIDFSVRGKFVRAHAEANVPTAAAFAEVDQNNPDRLHIISGNANSSDLVFDGVTSGTELKPADEQTERILTTYGCQTGLVSSNLISASALDYNGLTSGL